jgi:hypothetical protein
MFVEADLESGIGQDSDWVIPDSSPKAALSDLSSYDSLTENPMVYAWLNRLVTTDCFRLRETSPLVITLVTFAFRHLAMLSGEFHSDGIA